MRAQPDIERFLEDVARHQLIVIRDDGVNRHIRFKRPGCHCMHFDLITWPGYLCYTGDMGTYVFRRLNDMFQFFRRDPRHAFGSIDRRYWAEKLEAQDRCDGVDEFCPETFKVELRRWFDEHLVDTSATDEQRAAWWSDVESDVIDRVEDEDPAAAYRAASDFEIPGFGHPFRDFYEVDCKRWAFRFDWCCLALQWGIDQYDATKRAAQPEAVPA